MKDPKKKEVGAKIYELLSDVVERTRTLEAAVFNGNQKDVRKWCRLSVPTTTG